MTLNKIKSLKPEQYAWIIRSYFCLWLVKFQIKFNDSNWLATKLKFVRAEDISKVTASDQLGHCQDMRQAMLMHESIRLAARLHFSNAECLPRSIVLFDMLNRNGKQVELKIGVAKDAKGAFASHAWVELSGLKVAEPESVGQQFIQIEQPDTGVSD